MGDGGWGRGARAKKGGREYRQRRHQKNGERNILVSRKRK